MTTLAAAPHDFANSPPPTTAASIEQLLERVTAQIDVAQDRLRSLQTDAAGSFVRQQQKFSGFVAVADRIQLILAPRLAAFTNLNVFNHIKTDVSLSRRSAGKSSFRTVTKLFVPYCDKCPAPMEFSFCVSHDEPIQNAVIEYHLQILPVFLKFESDDTLVVPIDNFSEERIAAWIDEKLVGFTKTYFAVFFDQEYQKGNLVIDPVMNIQFPKSFAAQTTEYERRYYSFYTRESFEEFEKDPPAYVG